MTVSDFFLPPFWCSLGGIGLLQFQPSWTTMSGECKEKGVGEGHKQESERTKKENWYWWASLERCRPMRVHFRNKNLLPEPFPCHLQYRIWVLNVMASIDIIWSRKADYYLCSIALRSARRKYCCYIDRSLSLWYCFIYPLISNDTQPTWIRTGWCWGENFFC